MAISKLRSSGVMVAPSRAAMKNGGRRPEFFIWREAWGYGGFFHDGHRRCPIIVHIVFPPDLQIYNWGASIFHSYLRIEKITRPIQRVLQLHYRTSSMPIIWNLSSTPCLATMKNSGLRPPFFIVTRDGATIIPLLLYNYPFVIFI